MKHGLLTYCGSVLGFLAMVLLTGTTARAQTLPLPTVLSNPDATNRVLLVRQHGKYPADEAIMKSFSDRFQNLLTEEPGLTLVEENLSSFPTQNSEYHDVCSKMRTNAIVIPLYLWNVNEQEATVKVYLAVSDCYGMDFYWEGKIKTESRAFVNRSGVREITDMGNHLIDVLLDDFRAYKAAHASQWQNLVKYGIAADPPSGESGLFVQVEKKGEPPAFVIDAIRPDGLGARRGLRLADVIVSIDGQPVFTNDTWKQIEEQLQKANTVIVRRWQGDVSITLHPSKSSAPSAKPEPSPKR